MTNYMTTKDAAEKWGCTPKTVAKWCREDKLSEGNELYKKESGRWLIREDAVPPRRKSTK